MTWNYRLTKESTPDGDLYAIREVYYDNTTKKVLGWTEPIDVTGQSKKECIRTLKMMLKDAKNRPVLELPEETP